MIFDFPTRFRRFFSVSLSPWLIFLFHAIPSAPVFTQCSPCLSGKYSSSSRLIAGHNSRNALQSLHRHRLLFELQKRRGDFLGRFCHEALMYLDPRFILEISKPNSTQVEICRELKSRGAKHSCYAISMSDDIDRRFLPLVDALSIAVGHGLPSILSCLPGQMAYLETEQIAGPPDRFVLFRAQKHSDPSD